MWFDSLRAAMTGKGRAVVERVVCYMEVDKGGLCSSAAKDVLVLKKESQAMC